jgi:hypothetical protein
MLRSYGRRFTHPTSFLIALAGLIFLSLGCSDSSVPGDKAARAEVRRHFASWDLVTAQDLDTEDFATFSDLHPGLAPGFASGDYFGDGRKAYSALIRREDEEMGDVARLIILGLTPSGRFELYSIFTEMPVERFPIIFTSSAGEYEVYIDEEILLIPTEGVVYSHPKESAKLFFWDGVKFVDVEVGAEG